MATAWMIRNDGKEFAVDQHIYSGWDSSPEAVEETLFAAQWLYLSTAHKETQQKIIELICAWGICSGAAPDTFIEDLYTLIDAPYVILTKDFIVSIATDLVLLAKKDYSKKDVLSLAKEISTELNQEFMRVRYGGMYNTRAGSKEMVFRISSTGFNWYNIIYAFVYKNKKRINSVTIVRDEESTGVKDGYYKTHDGRSTYNQYSIDDFLVEGGNPTVEKKHLFIDKVSSNLLENELLQMLSEGKSVISLKRKSINKERLEDKLLRWKSREENICLNNEDEEE